MRYAAIILLSLLGCASQNKGTVNTELALLRADVTAKAQLISTLRTELDLSKKISMGDGSKYSGGAGWMFGAFCIFGIWSAWQHWRSSKDRARTKGKLKHG